MRDFEKVVKLLKEYKEEYGDCLVPSLYTTEDGISLGAIVTRIRNGYRKTTPEEKKILDSFGFVWRVRERSLSFNEVVNLLKAYKEEHGDCLVPQTYITEDEIPLGAIVTRIRSGHRKTTTEEKEILNNLGFAWKVYEEYISFNEVVNLLKAYKEEYGDCLVPQAYTTEDGIRLGSIVSCIRSGLRKTTPEEKKILDSFGFVWRVRERSLSFNEVVSLLKEYKKEYGNSLVPQAYITEDGIRLGMIVKNIRSGHIKTTLEEKEILDRLEG